MILGFDDRQTYVPSYNAFQICYCDWKALSLDQKVHFSQELGWKDYLVLKSLPEIRA